MSAGRESDRDDPSRAQARGRDHGAGRQVDLPPGPDPGRDRFRRQPRARPIAWRGRAVHRTVPARAGRRDRGLEHRRSWHAWTARLGVIARLRQLGDDDAAPGGTPRGAGVRERADRRRVAVATADGSGGAAAAADGRPGELASAAGRRAAEAGGLRVHRTGPECAGEVRDPAGRPLRGRRDGCRRAGQDARPHRGDARCDGSGGEGRWAASRGQPHRAPRTDRHRRAWRLQLRGFLAGGRRPGRGGGHPPARRGRESHAHRARRPADVDRLSHRASQAPFRGG